MRTGAVAVATTLLLCRVRMSITASARGGDHHMLAEEAVLLAFAGPSDSPRWLAPDETIELLAAEPAGNVAPAAASERIDRILADQEQLATGSPRRGREPGRGPRRRPSRRS